MSHADRIELAQFLAQKVLGVMGPYLATRAKVVELLATGSLRIMLEKDLTAALSEAAKIGLKVEIQHD